MSHLTSLAAAMTTNSCTYVRRPRAPGSPMVMVRCAGVCAFVRLSACVRATARSMAAAVASRCAAAMKASASCWLSVPSAWRSSAAIRDSILSSVLMLARLRDQYDFAAGVPGLQVAVRLSGLPERKHLVHRHFQLALGREFEQFRARPVADRLATVCAGQRRDAELGGPAESGDRRDPAAVAD